MLGKHDAVKRMVKLTGTVSAAGDVKSLCSLITPAAPGGVPAAVAGCCCRADQLLAVLQAAQVLG